MPPSIRDVRYSRNMATRKCANRRALFVQPQAPWGYPKQKAFRGGIPKHEEYKGTPPQPGLF
eukprot:1393240-Pyramimonas_sp.AAC.1